VALDPPRVVSKPMLFIPSTEMLPIMGLELALEIALLEVTALNPPRVVSKPLLSIPSMKTSPDTELDPPRLVVLEGFCVRRDQTHRLV
jgi:hypothetical protein